MKSRYKRVRRVLIFWTLFIGVGAIAGALAMLIDPSGKVLGMDAMLPYFQKLPFADVLFKNFVFSGISLLIVNGITNIIASILLFMNKKSGIILGGLFGITLMLWICIQFYMFPLNFMSTAYFIFGLFQTITGYICYIFCKQEQFKFNSDEYTNIGTNPDKLVVYFSRMGYVRKIAYQKANECGADIYEVKSTERTEGTLGFWWCGRFGMHRWDMPIEDITVDLTRYEEIIICSPIWVFSICAPIRTFLKQAKDKIKKVEYVFVHFTEGNYEKVALDVDNLLGIEHTSLENVICRMGKYKKKTL